MKKAAIGLAALMLLAAAATLARTGQEAGKLPKCSGQLCKSAGCSPDVLCARGAAVVTCEEVCGGH
jgi:hypothetical protein